MYYGKSLITSQIRLLGVEACAFFILVQRSLCTEYLQPVSSIVPYDKSCVVNDSIWTGLYIRISPQREFWSCRNRCKMIGLSHYGTLFNFDKITYSSVTFDCPVRNGEFMKCRNVRSLCSGCPMDLSRLFKNQIYTFYIFN